LKTWTGFDAVGIRLHDGKDFPYFVQDGFPKDFLQKENSLLERAQDGGVCLNPDGSIRLECTCGLVITGKTDLADQLCTPGGSIWTNDSSSLLEIPLDDDPRHHPRNECIHHGYASVALVPIKSQGKIVGLIHLNDRRKECFTIETVQLLEGVGTYIGTALMRKQLEEAERENVEKLERMNRLMMDREMRILEMKKEVNKLCKELGRPEPYSVIVS
jgi:GAF domain-containing protein